MPVFNTEIKSYADELVKLFQYQEEFNKIIPKLHEYGTVSDKGISVYIDRSEIFSVKNSDESFRIYPRAAYDTFIDESNIIKNLPLISYAAQGKSVMFMGELMYVDYAYMHIEELRFQYSTLYGQHLLDAFELVMYLRSIGFKYNFKINTGLDIDMIKHVNTSFDAMLNKHFEIFGICRVL